MVGSPKPQLLVTWECAVRPTVRCISCDGSGQASAVIAALDWLAGNVKLPAIASMSLGAGQPDAVLDAATTTILGLGVTVVTAAGNYNNGRSILSCPSFLCLNVPNFSPTGSLKTGEYTAI